MGITEIFWAWNNQEYINEISSMLHKFKKKKHEYQEHHNEHTEFTQQYSSERKGMHRFIVKHQLQNNAEEN